MGDYGGNSYDHTGDEEVKYVVHEDSEDWRWMQNARSEDAGAFNAAEEGEYDYEEEEFYDGINYELEYSYTCDSSQQVATEGATTSGYGHRRVRSVSAAHKDVLLENESRSSKSSEEDEYAAVKLKPKAKKKGVRGQFEHLQELDPVDAHSDPGYGGSYKSYNETAQPEQARSLSINLVNSWLRDATLGEHLKDSATTRQQAHCPPKRCPPPRRHPPEADMAAHDASRRSHGPNDHIGQCDYEPQYYAKTSDPSGYQYNSAYGYYEDHGQLATYDQLAMESIYRPEAKPLEKVLKFMRNGAVGFGNVSKTAAIGLGNVSKTAAVGLKSKSMEFKNMAVPVLTPILNAVIEEGKEQLMGPDQAGGGRSTSILGRGGGRGRGIRGRAPMMRPMQPGMRPSMPPGRMRPPGMRPVMRPGMIPGPLMRPGMAPPGGQPMARRSSMMPPQAGAPVRGQGVAMRGQPRPMGAARGRGRPAPRQPTHAAPTDNF